MAATAIAKSSKKHARNHRNGIVITLVVCFTLLLVLTTSLLRLKLSGADVTPPLKLNHLIKKACIHSPYPASCSAALTDTVSPPPHYHGTTALSLRHVLAAAINHTIVLVTAAREKIASSIPLQKLNAHEHNALRDCKEMLDQTYYELGESIVDLRGSGSSESYRNLKTLLSAAMTNENTCIDGFADLKETNSGARERFQIELAPISRMISNSLALIKYIETSNAESKIRSRLGFPPWMSARERMMLNRFGYRKPPQIRPNLVVAKDGTGHCRSIREAIEMAPSFSKIRFLIKIKSGVYEENVDIPRNKTNIMLAGDGMQSTVIASSRNFVDGFSTFTSATLNATFTSATLTVVGDRFLARDITILNRAGPEKHQAVALRATSTSAFFRCNITSYQDTLYAHSFHQLYVECVIQGTVDFIFGNAAAVFQNCLILARKPIRGQRNMITAQGRDDPNQNSGFSMQNCTIAAAPDLGLEDSRIFRTYLGRPWRNHSRTVIMNSYIGELVHPQGWYKWNKYSNLDTVEYVEYNNFGPGSETRRRVRWRGYKCNCTVDEVREFSVGPFLRGDDDWLLTTGFPFFLGP
ncbi:hypothetical protein V2J09_012401 [Rumex salicifolius]